jgi:hypothetical protein
VSSCAAANSYCNGCDHPVQCAAQLRAQLRLCALCITLCLQLSSWHCRSAGTARRTRTATTACRASSLSALPAA